MLTEINNKISYKCLKNERFIVAFSDFFLTFYKMYIIHKCDVLLL